MQNLPSSFFKSVAWLVVACVYGYLTLKAFLDFEVRYDFLFEHLPTALRLVHRTTYEYDWPLLEREVGFPQLAHFIQGALVVITHRLSAAKAVNCVGFAFSLLCIYYVKGRTFPYHLFLLYLLAVPLFVYHLAIGGYVDLFYGSMILAGFAAAQSIQQKPTNMTMAIMVTCLTAAMFSRIQAWVPTIIIAIYGCYSLYLSVQAQKISYLKFIATCALLLACVGFFPSRNLYLFGNPTYPAQNPIIENDENSFWKHSTLVEDIPPFLIGVPAPAQFLASLFEINRLTTNQPFYWTVNGESVKYSILKQSNHFRVGGWFFVTVILTLAGLAIAWKAVPRVRTSIGVLAVATLCISLIPHFLELRYSFFIPLIAIYIVCDAIGDLPFKYRQIFTALYCLSALYVAGHLIDFWNIDMRPASAYAPKEAVAFWKDPKTDKNKTYQIEGNQNVIFWSGPTFEEFKIKQKINLPPSYRQMYERILMGRQKTTNDTL